MQAINILKSLGYQILIEGNNLRLIYRGSGKPSKIEVLPLLKKLRKNKREAIEFLQKEQLLQTEDIDEIKNATLDGFARSDLVLKVKSSVLGEVIYFASDSVAEKLKDEGFVVYTATELELLVNKKPGPKELRAIHEIKHVFPGSKVLQ